jgi:predicted esterase
MFNATAPLGPYNIQTNSITVSGVSSGAYMANQLHISFSSTIQGAALFAGGPFYCAESTILNAETRCMNGSGGGPQVSKLVDLTYTDEKLGDVDPLSNLRDDHVYIFSGKLDTVVEPSVVKALEKYYEAFVPVGNIVTEYALAAEHCIPSLDYSAGEECDLLSTPYIGAYTRNCGSLRLLSLLSVAFAVCCLLSISVCFLS